MVFCDNSVADAAEEELGSKSTSSNRNPQAEEAVRESVAVETDEARKTEPEKKSAAGKEPEREEKEKVEEQNKDLLTDTDYPAPDAEQKALSKDYSANPYQHAVLKNTYRSDFTVAGGKTPPAKTTNDLPMGDKSPMTKVSRPPRPATGANPRG